MALSDLHLDLLILFFIYGLAFFSMGLALALETARSPLLAERRVIRPLAIFGLLHGIHEWMEIYILQSIYLGAPFPTAVQWFRVIWLVLSFVPLIVFAVLQLGSTWRFPRGVSLYLTLGLLAVYAGLVAYQFRIAPTDLLARADTLARYVLAVPGGILAGLALLARARGVKVENRQYLVRRFQWAAIGFGIYGATQIFVAPVNMFPGNTLNTELFLSLAGIPIQVVRAAMAIWILANLLLAIQAVERERQHQLVHAQQARLEALVQVQRDLVEREALRRELLRHTVNAQEDERARIARELHDETAQVLTAITLNLAALRDSTPENPKTSEILTRLQSLSRQMSQGIYRLVHDLRPAQLDDLGLVAALQYLADEEHKRVDLNVTLEIDGQPQRLDPLVETVFFRVAQEALSNVTRHAKTTRASIQLIFNPREAVLRVCDEGVGFDPEVKRRPPRGWGLAGMRERAEAVGGRLVLKSAPGHGATVEVTIPIAYEEAAHEYNPLDAG